MPRAPRVLAICLLVLGPACAFAATRGGSPESHRVVVARVPPLYPELARRMRISGEVVLMVDVRPDGSVGETRVESGHALLRRAAEDAVRQWRFAAGPPAVVSVAVSFASPLN